MTDVTVSMELLNIKQYAAHRISQNCASLLSREQSVILKTLHTPSQWHLIAFLSDGVDVFFTVSHNTSYICLANFDVI